MVEQEPDKHPVLLAIVERDGVETMRVEKVRIYSHQVRDSLVSGDDLRAILGDITPHCTLQVYDTRQQAFVAIERSETLVDRFGRCIRVRIENDDTAASEPCLAIAGRYFANDFCHGQIRVADHVLTIVEDSLKQEQGTGVMVWDGAILLVRYLERHVDNVQGCTVLELGSGCGLVGIAASLLGATEVFLTDLSYCLPLLSRSIAANRSLLTGPVDAIEYDWYGPLSDRLRQARIDVVLVADCVWVVDLVEPLLSAMEAVLEAHPLARIVMSYQRRGTDTNQALWTGLRQRFGSISILIDAGLDQPDALQLISIQK